MRLYFILGVLALLLVTQPASAQRATFSGVESSYFQKSGVLRTGGVISGYYIINYNKPMEGEGYYVLQLLDQDLNKVGEKPLSPDENLRIGSVAYNGERLGVEMLDHERNRKWIEIFDGNGEFQHRRQMTYSPIDLPGVQTIGALFGGTTMVAATGGFLHFNTATDGKRPTSDTYYRVTYVPNDADDRGWSTRSSSRMKDSQGAAYLTSNDSMVVFAVYTMTGGKMSTKCTMSIMGYGLHSGKKLFSYAPDAKEIQTRYIKGQIVGDELVVVGTNVGKSSKVFTDHPIGIDVIKLSLGGKVIERSGFSIEEDMADHFDVSRQGKIKGLGSLFIHDLGITAKQEIVIAGEFYKVFNGDIKIEEGLLIQLRPDLTVAEVKLIEKGRTGSMLDDGISNLLNAKISLSRAPIIAAVSKLNHDFDFAFLDQGREVITTTYFSGRTEVKESNRLSLYVNTLLDGELMEDKVEFAVSSDRVIVLPAKEGYLAVIEYSKKNKSLDIHMERLKL